MLRHAGVVTALAGVVWSVLPGHASQTANVDGPRVRALQQAVRDREHAIGVLTEIGVRLSAGTATGVDLRSITETPDGDARERDERLELLRADVAQLERHLETLRSGGTGTVPVDVRASSGALTIGLGPEELSLLRPAAGDGARPGPGPVPLPVTGPRAGAIPESAPVASATLALPTAERVRQARASFHAGQPERALALLEGLDADIDALHWRGRSLERLGRLDEARGALRLALATREAEEPARATVVARVRADLEHVEWSIRLRDTARSARTQGGKP